MARQRKMNTIAFPSKSLGCVRSFLVIRLYSLIQGRIPINWKGKGEKGKERKRERKGKGIRKKGRKRGRRREREADFCYQLF